MESEAKTQAWLDVMLTEIAKQVTVTEAAERLGVSRKTYYEKKARALAAMESALRDRPTGRPGNPVDPEKDALKADLADARAAQELLASRLRIREVLQSTLLETSVHLPRHKKNSLLQHCDRSNRTGTGKDRTDVSRSLSRIGRALFECHALAGPAAERTAAGVPARTPKNRAV